MAWLKASPLQERASLFPGPETGLTRSPFDSNGLPPQPSNANGLAPLSNDIAIRLTCNSTGIMAQLNRSTSTRQQELPQDIAAVNHIAISPHTEGSADSTPHAASIQAAIEHAAHLLPSQGPIRIFIHHNTLHAFEDEPFEDAVVHARDVYGCNPYIPENEYRKKYASGRIRLDDITSVLKEDLGERADESIAGVCTRLELRAGMLQYPLRTGTDPELRWLIAETDALSRFSTDAPTEIKEKMIEETRHWVMRDFAPRSEHSGQRSASRHGLSEGLVAIIHQLGGGKIESWSETKWESLTLHLLWQCCRSGVHGIERFQPRETTSLRLREPLRQASGIDIDQLLNDNLIPFCAAFLDQGISHWPLPNRNQGFFRAYIELYRNSPPIDPWRAELPSILDRINESGETPLQVIEASLRELGVPESQWDAYLTETLLCLRGWAGMLWQMETNAEWTVAPAPPGTLLEYAAIRLLLERIAIQWVLREVLKDDGDLKTARKRVLHHLRHDPKVSVEQRSFTVFQLAQFLGFTPELLSGLSKDQWTELVREIEAFSDLERRRIFQQAFERRYRNQTLDAIITHNREPAPPLPPPRIQISCCLDDREESFRRHLEEIAPDCETFGVAGFYGVAMYYRGAADAHFVPLCPVVIKPQHYVREEVVYPLETSSRIRQETRKALGRTRHWLHTGSRSILGGAMTALLGTVASLPLVMRVLFPRLTSRTHRLFTSLIRPPMMTRLHLERREPAPGKENGHLGFTLDEMVTIGRRVLEDIGLTRNFAPLVILIGHGSSTQNNPHESAYDCGACGGNRGGPNSRALASILNDPRVRHRLAENGLTIPWETVFVGAYHNTCDDSVTYADLHQLPFSHREHFEYAREIIDEARRRNAHERCRRFVSAPLSITEEAALRHVEARSEDISQVRPELGHATNAVGIVGRRSRTRNLFMDRRAFLTSYDPTQDTPEGDILERILSAAVPVCAGINLEYYFSFVDSAGYGCGSKLPHNITSLLGVMDGAASDLRPGLPWQMVEIHEPLRVLFVVETTPEMLTKILNRNAVLRRLIENRWVQMSVLDPDSPEIQVYQGGAFHPYQPESSEIPEVARSQDWYRGWRDHLGYARITPKETVPTQAQAMESAGVS